MMSPHLPSRSIRSMFYKLLFLLVLLFGGLVELCAQFYPIHGTVQWPAPQSPHLVDYYSGSRDRLIITLHNRDLQQPLLLARLRIQIKSNGFLAQTREEFPYPMLELMAGTPTRLTATDLMPYLRPENLVINGRLRNGQLPTGFTEVSVQVIDYYSKQVLSSWHTARAYLESKQPPILNLPQRDEQVAYRDPLFIRFQWYPRHQGLSGTEYEFVLKELPDNGAAPQSAFAYGNEIYRTRTRHTTLNYTHLEPILLPNRRYAWQVQAIARDGIDEIGMFENRGFSEIYWFTLNENCPLPTGLKAEPRYAKVDFSWNRVVGATGYMLACRPKTSKNIYEWSEVQSYGERMTLSQLKPGWTYEWRVGTLCMGDKPIYSAIQEVTLPKTNLDLLADCGKEPLRPNLSPEPALDVQVGDTVTIGGDYPMLITQLQSLGNGWYSGRGTTRLSSIIELPRVALRFDRLRINIEKCQIDGLVEAIYDEKLGKITDLDKLDDGGKKVRPSQLRIRTREVTFALPEMPQMSLNTETGELEVRDAEGNPQRIKLDLPEGGDYASAFPMVITDSEGNSYQLSPQESSQLSDNGASSTSSSQGQVAKKQMLKVERLEHIGNFNPDVLNTKYGLVRFDASAQTRYAFDLGTESRYQRSVKLDEYYKPLAKGYIAPWKLIPTGGQDVIRARYEGKKAIDLSRVRFASEPNSPAIPAEFDERTKTWQLSLSATDAQTSYNVFAIYEGQVIGKLRVVSYPKQSYRVRLISVNGQSVGDVSSLSQHLNSIYNKYGVSFTLYEGEDMTAVFSSENLKSELKELNKQYKQEHTLTSEDVCIFVLSEELSKGSKYEEIEGLMQRGKRFGYIFAGNSPNEEALARILAHELGHGLFTLGHTFDSDYNKGKIGATKNLMDYAGEEATKLAAYQWNIMANPAPFTSFDRDKDAQLLKKGTIWLTPDRKPFSYDEANTLKRDPRVVNGTIGIIIPHNREEYTYDSSRGEYISSNGQKLAIRKNISLADHDSVFLYDAEHGRVYAGVWSYVKEQKTFDFSASNKNLRYVRDVVSISIRTPDRFATSGKQRDLFFIGKTSAYKDQILDLLHAKLEEQAGINSFTQREFASDICFAIVTGEQDTQSEEELKALRKAYELVIQLHISITDDGTVILRDLQPSKPIKSDAVGLKLERIKELIANAPWFVQAIILYELSDLLDKGIQYLKIPESVWSCTDGVNVYARVIQELLSVVLPTREIQALLSKQAALESTRFAFICGLWNGTVDVVQSVPQLVKLFTCAFHSDCRSEVSSQWESFKSLEIRDEQGRILCDSTAYFCKGKELIKASLANIASDNCKLAHTVGSVVGPIVVLSIGDVPAAGAILKNLGAASQGVGKAIQFLRFCDQITDITSPLIESGKLAISLVKNGDKLIPEISSRGTKLLSYVDNRYRLTRANSLHGVDYPETALTDGTLARDLRNTLEEIDGAKADDFKMKNNLQKEEDIKTSRSSGGGGSGAVPAPKPTSVEGILDDILATTDGQILRGYDEQSLKESIAILLPHHKRLAKDPKAIKALVDIRTHRNFKAFDLTDELLGKISSTVNTEGYAQIVANLRIFIDKFDPKRVEGLVKLVGDLGDEQASFREGAEWTLRYLANHADEFTSASKISFEVAEILEEGKRVADMVVKYPNLSPIYYEFKSVKNLPPGNFLDQFGKDLSRDKFSVRNLRWIFDGKKIKPEDLQGLRKSLERIENVKQQASKLKLRESEFVDIILTQVFIVK